MELTEKNFLEFLKSKKDERYRIAELFKNFTDDILPRLKEKKKSICNNNQNVYQLCDADKLAAANNITRTYNTELGLLWEKIANLSPNVVSPELDFKHKIPEVDNIVLYENKLYYVQLKTQKNTLTGSQGTRTVKELGKYENHWFVACIDTQSKWTAPSGLNRLVGKEFWDKIHIDYENDILLNLKNSIKQVEEIYGIDDV